MIGAASAIGGPESVFLFAPRYAMIWEKEREIAGGRFGFHLRSFGDAGQERQRQPRRGN